MPRSRQNNDFTGIERKLSISYGMLIFVLMGIIFLSAISYFNYVINKEQNRLSSVIASSIGDSINRISFSGKYQARLLIEEFASKNPNIDSIIIQDASGEVIAHSKKENNGATIIDTDFEKAKTVITTRNYLIHRVTAKRDGKEIELIEIDMPYKKGYDEDIVGVTRVFLSTNILSNFITDGIFYFSILIVILTLISIVIIRTISNHIGSPIKKLALQLQGILEYAPLGIYISDRKGNIHAYSAIYATIGSFMQTEQNKLKEKEVFETGNIETYDFTVSINNKENYFHITKCPIARDDDGAVSLVCTIALDITEQKEYEKKIESLLEEQSAFFQNTVVGIAYLKDRIITKANEAWEKMFGYETGELIGKKTRVVYPSEEEYEKFGETVYAEISKNGYSIREQVLLKKDGSPITVLLNGVYLDKNDPSKGSVWVGVDITYMKNIEKELMLINKTLEQRVEEETKKRLEAEHIAIQQSKMALMGEMIGAIAHQWRQPLNALGITIQDIKEAYKYGELNEEYINQTVATSMDRINFMSKTIDDFRNFFSPNKPKSRFFIEEAIEGVINIVSAQLKSHDIVVKYDHTEKLEFFGYKSELQQVILNIISNAKDAIIENKSTIRRIEISTTSNNNELCITIEDTGGGIPANIMDRIFEPYYTTKEQGKGTGIGLYMSKQIIERHMDGELRCENSGFGAKFTIKLPIVNL